MKKLITILLMLLPLLIQAQLKTGPAEAVSRGIRFEPGISWQQVLAKARAANKYIFVDCYATWCGPCRYMADSIFTKEEVGDFMNRHFISVSLQMDTTEKDSPAIKDRYGDANRMMEKYQVTAFPTFLFFTPDGEWIYKAMGAFAADAFITKASKALDPDEQYFFLLEQYYKGRKEPAFIVRLLEAATRSGDKEMVSRLKKEQTNPDTGSASFIQK